MGRSDLERLSKEELIELVLRLQRPEKTSRTSSKPPSTDRKEQREKSKPGGAKPGQEGHSRTISDTPDEVVDHRPGWCSCCGAALMTDLPSETVSLHEHVDLPEVKPLITHHRRLSVCCSTCGTRVVAPVPEAARGTPFGPRLHAVATYLKTFQALSYERLQSALSDLFGLTLSQGGLMNLLRRAQGCFAEGQVSAVSQNGYVLDEIVQPRRDTKAAERLLRRLLKKQGWPPRRMITDKLGSYAAARRQIMPAVEHRSHKGLNNRAENSHLLLRRREQAMQGFRSTGGLQRFVSIFSAVRNLFVPPRSRRSALSTHLHCLNAMAEWKSAASVAA